MNGDGYRAFLDVLRRLDRARIAYRFRLSRDEAVMSEVNMPGER